MKRDWLKLVTLWAALIVAGEAVIGRIPILPPQDSREAVISDHAFKFLSQLAVPVFAFIVAFLIFALLRFRSKGKAMPTEDGPALKSSRTAYSIWLTVTSGLAVLVIINPGLTGLADIRGTQRADLVVNVTGAQWAWTVAYPTEGAVLSTNEMVLPIDQRIRFDVTSKDVIHSFWVPAFRMKIDALPGATTSVYVTTTRLDSYQRDDALRIQCAELCGLNHATMEMPVRVVSEADFRAWLVTAKKEQQQSGACSPTGLTLQIVASNTKFSKTCLAAPANTGFSIVFQNKDSGVPHNVAIYTDKNAKKALFVGDIVTGTAQATYKVGALPPGTYFFRCDVHPNSMFGTFVVH